MAVNIVTSSKTSQTAHNSSTYVEIVDIALPKVVWVLQAYQKEGDAFVEQWPLADIDTATLHDIFAQPLGDPMYDSYPVSEAQAKRLQRHTNHVIDLSAYDYFVECYAK